MLRTSSRIAVLAIYLLHLLWDKKMFRFGSIKHRYLAQCRQRKLRSCSPRVSTVCVLHCCHFLRVAKRGVCQGSFWTLLSCVPKLPPDYHAVGSARSSFIITDHFNRRQMRQHVRILFTRMIKRPNKRISKQHTTVEDTEGLLWWNRRPKKRKQILRQDVRLR